MKRSVILLLPLAFNLGGCGSSEPLGTYLYELEVVVETPEGVRSGSSIISVSERINRSPDWCHHLICNPTSLNADYSGEAVAVDLPGGDTVYLPLGTRDDYRPSANFSWAAYAARIASHLVCENANDGERCQLTRIDDEKATDLTGVYRAKTSDYGFFVTFDDERDPHTARRVDADGFAEEFGEGIELSSVTVSDAQGSTNSMARPSINKRLPWLTGANPNLNEETKSFFNRYLSKESFLK